jgi:uncharacterized phage infection (PIP) family protein YhgE
VNSLKQERVTNQYEQIIQTLEEENEVLKSVKDEQGQRMDMLTDEIEQLKKIVSELMLNNALKSGQHSHNRLPSNHSIQTRGSSVKRIQPVPINIP